MLVRGLVRKPGERTDVIHWWHIDLSETIVVSMNVLVDKALCEVSIIRRSINGKQSLAYHAMELVVHVCCNGTRQSKGFRRFVQFKTHQERP